VSRAGRRSGSGVSTPGQACPPASCARLGVATTQARRHRHVQGRVHPALHRQADDQPIPRLNLRRPSLGPDARPFGPHRAFDPAAGSLPPGLSRGSSPAQRRRSDLGSSRAPEHPSGAGQIRRPASRSDGAARRGDRASRHPDQEDRGQTAGRAPRQPAQHAAGDNPRQSATTEALAAVCDLGLSELQAIEPPRGFHLGQRP